MSDPSNGSVIVVAEDGAGLASELDAHADCDVQAVAPSSLGAGNDDVDCVVVDGDALRGSAVKDALEEGRVPVVLLESGEQPTDALTGFVRRFRGDALVQLAEEVEWIAQGGYSVGRDDRIARMHRAATDIVGAESEDELFELTLEAAERILAFDISYLNIIEGDRFVPVAKSPDRDEYALQEIPLDHGVTGETYHSSETFHMDDIEAYPLADPVHGIDGSGMSIPFGDYGVFQAVSNEKGAYTETDVELAELLVAYAAETLARLRTEAALHEREAELEGQNERLEEFASVVSHDLRNPLSVAQGNLDLARETGEEAFFEKATAAHGRMEELIEDLLAVAREGQVTGDTGQVDLAEAVHRAWASIDAPASDLTVRADGAVEADADRLVQLLENLFRNAVEHGSTSSRPEADDVVEHAATDVDVVVVETDDGFAVTDDGPGIPAETRDTVLEYGYSSEEDGTGLGLAIVREIAEAHGWTIEVGESEDGGARFDVLIE